MWSKHLDDNIQIHFTSQMLIRRESLIPAFLPSPVRPLPTYLVWRCPKWRLPSQNPCQSLGIVNLCFLSFTNGYLWPHKSMTRLRTLVLELYHIWSFTFCHMKAAFKHNLTSDCRLNTAQRQFETIWNRFPTIPPLRPKSSRWTQCLPARCPWRPWSWPLGLRERHSLKF